MTDKVKAFLERVSSDETLKAGLKASMEGKDKTEKVSNVLQFAKKQGCDLSEEDLVSGCDELSEDELEAIVGGGKCICVAFGECDEDGLFCWCLGYGTGGVGGSLPNSQGGCQCVGAGAGFTNRH